MALVALLASSCVIYETNDAKKLMVEASSLEEDGGDWSTKADKTKSDAALTTDEEKRQADGKKCEKQYATAIEKLEEAAELIVKASKLKLRKEYARYVEARLKHNEKAIELTGLHRKMCTLLSKPKFDGKAADALVAQARAAKTEAEELDEEAVELGKKAKD